jgi:hypothetical protein
VGVIPDICRAIMPANGWDVRESIDGSSAHSYYQESVPTVNDPLRKSRTSSQYATPGKRPSKSVSQAVAPAV